MGTKSRSSNRACGALAAVMSDIVIHSASQMTDADLSTIAVYLKDLPPQSHTSAGTGSGVGSARQQLSQRTD
jgi:hypothetical protein